MAAVAAVPVGIGIGILTCLATDVGHFPASGRASGRCGCGDSFNCDVGSSIGRNLNMVVMRGWIIKGNIEPALLVKVDCSR